MNPSKKPVVIYVGDGLISYQDEHQDHYDYTLNINEYAIASMAERVLINYATEVEELKQRIAYLEGKIERLESKL